MGKRPNNVLAVLCAIAQLSAHHDVGYEATLILKMPERGLSGRSYIGGIVLTQAGLVGGFTCDETGVHGETFFGNPFVFARGKLHRLPLGKSKYGHVYASNGKAMVGDVDIDYKDYPAIWTPDPEKGWSHALLKVFSNEPGRAKAISSDGTIWIQSPNVIYEVKDGRRGSFTVGNFWMEAVDGKGRIYGNQQVGQGEGTRILKSGYFDGDKWHTLAEKGGSSWIGSVNGVGMAAGSMGSSATVWKNGQPIRISESKGFSTAKSINSKGEVVGYFVVPPTSHAFLWKDGVLTDLFRAVPRLELSEALAINDGGSIVAKMEKDGEVRLYLLTPSTR